MKEKYHEIICIIDRSGSMESIKSDAIGGFNSFIESQRKFDGEAALTLVLFNDYYKIVYDRKDIQTVPFLNDNTYVPGGTTAMLDAIGRTIDSIGERLNKTPEEDRPEKVIVSILTDGLENDSKEYTYEQVGSRIKRQQEKYNWEFIFLAANQDAVASAKMISIDERDAVDFEATPDGIYKALYSMNEMIYDKRIK
ncbi:vWA domain-containing protein [Ilyobacter polytropus]|uniref:VWFA domain-containing protein n=1 Tax=Ilyobacter polytropus (strain ATCC 51220 / DSM 2926 / LMG 16218 / CuHBu1) TaxID=572544 RepID=E3HC75_ILYPC|nr:VWA domain-containing protein [Ilyobacter polytropus]ADO83918.1 conserved hypothetical protein [Ilyobacter polytropus DSM 2926]